ncbi:MAG TPA: hypothetical protein DHW82_11885 [Spirochaetia bacterium]|nr:MAG: hypothetical protein A2Y41_12425 [Spirochaetes bacterium GWB1_36_13]HCL57691.1 hypothetical protein [Spirochaetia bacterium]
MDVVILAAGLGSRLKGLTEDKPKAMVSVLNKTLIDYALEFIDLSVINRVFIIGGYKKDILENHLKTKNNKKIFFIENKDYSLGSTLTIEKAVSKLEDSFLLMNVDHIYPRKMFDKIMRSVNDLSLTAMTDSDRTLVDDDMKVELNPDLTIKKISKTLTVFQKGYIGMTFIGKKNLEIYKNALKTVIQNTEGKANVEAVLDFLSKDHPIDVLDLSGFGWHEVDNQEDLEKAETQLK